ncbi:MAG: hypothetical protein HYS22_03785 [Deltaproteobacteria bacterium]|nr:hypothetical protein [Deltaproteobacteria bacterium]
MATPPSSGPKGPVAPKPQPVLLAQADDESTVIQGRLEEAMEKDDILTFSEWESLKGSIKDNWSNGGREGLNRFLQVAERHPGWTFDPAVLEKLRKADGYGVDMKAVEAIARHERKGPPGAGTARSVWGCAEERAPDAGDCARPAERGKAPTQVTGTDGGTPLEESVNLPAPFVSVLGKRAFEEQLGKMDKAKPVALFVWARHCSHCQEQKPAITEAARGLAGMVQFIGVEFPFQAFLHPEVSFLKPNEFVVGDYRVEGFPSILILTHNGSRWGHEKLPSEGGLAPNLLKRFPAAE